MNPTVVLYPSDFIKLDSEIYEVIAHRKDEYILKDKIEMKEVIMHIDELSNKFSSCNNVQIWRDY